LYSGPDPKVTGIRGLRVDGRNLIQHSWQLRGLIRNAGALLSPSLVEGFGRPPVEAVALGTPIIISDIAAHREALAQIPSSEMTFVHPKEREAWTQKMIDAMEGKIPRPTQESTKLVIDRYSIENSGKIMDQAYCDVLRKNYEQ
jgi:glycosyltransferase involved in cell wall biosynthesis